MAFHRADLQSIHQFCHRNRERLEGSAQCGCFYCLAIFAPVEIENWTDGPTDDKDGLREVTALCPRCGIDAVLPDNMPDVPLSAELLKAMKQYWFHESDR